jgi:glycosyltransferase involved in cell wall biosynthesis
MNPEEQNALVLPFPSSNILYIILNLFFLKKYRSGIYHITGHVHYAALALPKESTILTIHDLVFLNTYRGLRKFVMKWLFLDLPVKRVKWITTVSEKTKQEIIHNSNCDPSKIIVIENPIDPLLQMTTSDFNHLQPILLFLGTKRNKNLENSIPALFNLNIKLRIIGELTYQQQRLLEKYRIEYFALTNLNDDDLRKEYNNCNIVLFPSFYEGFGLPLIEAFSVGKPVITSDFSPMKDIAEDAALYVNPHSISSIRGAVQMLIANSVLRNEMTSKGIEVVKKYNAQLILDKYQSLWKKVIAESTSDL